MTWRGILCLAAMALFLAAAPSATAGDTLSIRLIEASHAGDDNPAGIEDVLGVLRKSLAYTRFRLVTQVNSPIGGTQSPNVGGYRVVCTGTQENMSIVVYRGNEELVKTLVSLQDGKPLIVGGFPSRNGTYVLIFVAR